MRLHGPNCNWHSIFQCCTYTNYYHRRVWANTTHNFPTLKRWKKLIEQCYWSIWNNSIHDYLKIWNKEAFSACHLVQNNIDDSFPLKQRLCNKNRIWTRAYFRIQGKSLTCSKRASYLGNKSWPDSQKLMRN